VDQLAKEYAGQPVVFLEHNVDSPPPTRYDRWWAAYTGGSVYVPLIMVDSGNQISNGWVDFYGVYKGMVDAELARPPQALVLAYWWRTGDRVHFSVQVTNSSGGALGEANRASVHAMVYEVYEDEEALVHTTRRFVQATVTQGVGSLDPGEGAAFNLETDDLTGVDWNRLFCLAAVDYRPAGSSGPYDMLQAAVALPVGASLSVRPDALTFEVNADDAVGPTAAVWVEALDPVPWSTSSSASWLSVTPPSGATPSQVTVAVLKDGLAPGSQEAALTFSSGDGLYSDQLTVRVHYTGFKHVYLPLLARH
jgi:hypothetical protein